MSDLTPYRHGWRGETMVTGVYFHCACGAVHSASQGPVPDTLCPARVAVLLDEVEQLRGSCDLHHRLNRRVAEALGLTRAQTDENGQRYLPSWHDMPERVTALLDEVERLRAKADLSVENERAAESTRREAEVAEASRILTLRSKLAKREHDLGIVTTVSTLLDEVERLKALLDCEAGIRAPEGWQWGWQAEVQDLCWHKDAHLVGVATGDGYALEAIEAVEKNDTTMSDLTPDAIGRPSIYHLIDIERERQDAKWGEQNHPFAPGAMAGKYPLPTASEMQRLVDRAAKLGVLSYAEICLEEFCEAVQESQRGNTEALRVELIQTAACIVAAIESLDRNGR